MWLFAEHQPTMAQSPLRQNSLIITLALISTSLFLIDCGPDTKEPSKLVDPNAWIIPDSSVLASSPEADLIRYGKELIINTSHYLGPRGIVSHLSNGMNCGNCHLEAGTRFNGINFAKVASTYPKFRERSGRSESVEFRVNDCMERSMNGKKLDSLSKEMRAMVAYMKWLGKDLPVNANLKGIGIPALPFLKRAALADSGKNIFVLKCVSCHGINGQGLMKPDSTGYIYPPLWGSWSYNVSAGIYMLTRTAGFIKYNMPYTNPPMAPQLTDEEAWDLAAFINSQQRPEKFFLSDWPILSSKPVDYPFGPYADSFTKNQHKYGPFEAIKKAKEALIKENKKKAGNQGNRKDPIFIN